MDIIIWMIIAVILVFIWVCAFDTNRFTVSRYEFTDPRIKRPVKAVFISDLHCKMFGYEGTFLVEKIKEISPDLILVGGDLITAHPGAGTDKVIEMLKHLAGFPIVYAFGNHELRLKLYPETYGDTWKEYVKKLSEIGISITENGIYRLEGTEIDIISFSADREYYRRMKKITMDPEYIRKTAGEFSPESFNILLAHNPAYFESYVSYGADLTLSGHVHGGMVRIPGFRSKNSAAAERRMRGVISPSVTLFPEYDAGRFDRDGRTMIISRGLGTHTLPIRFLNPGELIVLDLKPPV